MLLRLSTTSRASGSLYSAASSVRANVAFPALSRTRRGFHSYTPSDITSHNQLPSALKRTYTLATGHSHSHQEPGQTSPSSLANGASSPRTHSNSHGPSQLRASLTLPAVAGVACLILAALFYHRRQTVTDTPPTVTDIPDLTHQDLDMSAQMPPGRPGNLTPEQEEKLRQLWQMIFQVTAVWPSENGSESQSAAAESEVAESVKSSDKTPKKNHKVRSMFSRKSKKDGDAEPTTPTSAGGNVSQIKEAEDDKYGQTKHFHETLANQSPESIRDTIWHMLKHDHPDALVLRFLRARKWDVEKALVMLISTMNWRARDMHVDDDIMLKGEGGAVAAAETGDQVSKDFLAQMKMGKSFLHGVDKSGRPICVVRVRLHRQGEQVEESLERYTVYLIETCRMLLQPPVDTATIVFDMTGFSMANMDYTPVKFMIKCFEANYPESLGAVLVHKSPWIFQGIWKVIKGWLDPVVAGKVHFTNNVKDVEEFIAAQHIPKELDGQEDWEYKYVDPVPGENDRMKDAETRDRILAERQKQYEAFEQATIRWIQNPDGETAKEVKAEREKVAAQLREGYWRLDPYVRARSLYDRMGVIKEGGEIEFYPVKEEVKAEPVPAPAPVQAQTVDTSADDVD